MRYAVWIALALGMPLVACSSSVGSPPQAPIDWGAFDAASTAKAPTNAPTPKERGVAEAYATALASPAFAQLAPLLDEDAHFAFPGMDDARGRSQVVHAHDVLFGAFDQRHFVTTRVLRTASEQTTEWTMAGVHARDWMRVAASQKPVMVRGVTLLWTKDDGSILDIHVYLDVAAVKAQLGAAPKGLAPIALSPVPTEPPQVIDQNGTEADTLGTVRTALDALENNEGTYLGALTDDIEVHTLERAEPLLGKDGARAYYKVMHKAIAQLDTTLDNGWGVAQFAVVEYTIAGEQLGPIGWVPAQKDAVIRLHVVDVNELRDGRIARIWRYENPGEIAAPGP
jgi:ketosteroid isomerase-like protein